jgi:hypothetical protein
MKAVDLPEDGVIVTIDSVTTEQIGEDRQLKPVVAFTDHDHDLILNITNWNSITAITGEENSDRWHGHKLKLVKTRVTFGGRTVQAVRIEPAPAKTGNPREPHDKQFADAFGLL